MKRRWPWVLGAAAVLAAAGFFALRPRIIAAPAISGVERTATIERGDLEVWVTGTGKIQPAAQTTLAFKVSGNVGEVYVRVGDRVEEGQTLMELDPDSLDASMIGAQADLIAAREQLQTLLDTPTAQQLAQAQLAVAQARDALDEAQYRWRVQQQGYRANSDTIDAAEAKLLLAEHEVDQAQAAYDRLSGQPSDDPARAIALTNLVNARQARDAALRALNWYTGHPSEIEQAILDAQVALAEADLKEAERALAELLDGPDPDELAAAEARLAAAQAIVDQAKLVAPFAATVMSVTYRQGDTISLGQTAAVLADLTTLHVDTTVDELDIAVVRSGQKVEITLDALPDTVLQGSVAEIDLAPAAGGGTTEFPVMVELTSTRESVRIGMTASLNILVARHQGIVLVPNWALRVDPDSGEIYVQVLQGAGEVIQVPVSLGLRSDSYSEVLSGVSPGQVVVISVAEPEPEGRGPFFGGGG